MKTISNVQCAMCNDQQPRKMKDSGIEWIGEIPEGWDISKIKYHLKWKSEKGYPTEQVLSLYRDYGIIPKNSRDDNHNVTSLDTSGYKLVDEGDFVINKMKAWQGSMAVSGFRGIISPAYHVCEFTDDRIYRKYFHYLMRNTSYLPEYERLSTGMRIGQWDLQYDDFKNIPFLIPCITEQQAIAAHLDRICSEIDSVTAKTKATIEEYKKLKQAIIAEAVTKGISKGRKMKDSGDSISNEQCAMCNDSQPRKMKDSGIEWIGEIPEEWVSVPLKFLVSYNDETLGENTEDDFEFDYIDIGSVEYGKGITYIQPMRFIDSPSRARRIVKENDVILSTVRTYLKAVAKIHKFQKPQIVSTGFIVLRARCNKIRPDYLDYSVLSNAFISMVESKSVGISYPAINSSEVVTIKIPVPPLSEQQAIAAHLDEKCAAIDTLIAKKEQLLTELESYKKSVIYEYVTGKKTICNVQ